MILFLIPGEEPACPPEESVGWYCFRIQSIWNPAGFTILYHAKDRTSSQYHSNPFGVPVLFQEFTLCEFEHPVYWGVFPSSFGAPSAVTW